ncbi:hypothetical protein FOA52_013710 [Chlamydomonas sp. UWO 241]|nr:hypothetical protein FOA52_013710 [Chlamydomonas sp. UWO 241]
MAGDSRKGNHWILIHSSAFYKARVGELSCYGHELVPLIRSMAAKGGLDEEAYAEELYTYFNSDPDLYRNQSIKKVVEHWEAGKRGTAVGHETDHQANCFAKAALIVARYGGTAELAPKMEAAIRVQQNNDDAVKYGLAAAAVLERVIVSGESVADALTWASSSPESPLPDDMRALVKKAADTAKTPMTELQYEVPQYMAEMVNKHVAAKDSLPPFTWSVWCIGPACGNPAALTNVLAAAATFPSYVDGVRANLVAGGDNCSRGLLVGALLAAQCGMDSVPASWRERTDALAELEPLVDQLMAAPAAVISAAPLSKLKALWLALDHTGGGEECSVPALSHTAAAGLQELQVTSSHYQNLILSIEAVRSCARLRTPVVKDCTVSNLSALAGCAHLEELATVSWHGNISDLAPLGGCAKLKKLWIPDSQVPDLAPLHNCVDLRDINIGGCVCLVSLEGLQAFSKLERLIMSYLSVTSLEPLSACGQLRTLDINVCASVSSLAPLSASRQLERLGMSWCSSVSSLAPLSACTNLKRLFLHGCTSVASVEPLTACAQLQDLYVRELAKRLPGLAVLKAALPQLRIK